MDSLEYHKTVLIDHEVQQDGVKHKELKEITTVTALCDQCQPYNKDGECPCPKAKGPLQTILTHECRIGDRFYKVSEVRADTEVLDRTEDSSMEDPEEIADFKADWKQKWAPAITAKALADQTEAVLKIFEPITNAVPEEVEEKLDQN